MDDINKFVLSICNKKSVDKIIEQRRRVQTVQEYKRQKLTPLHLRFPPRDKYPSLKNAQYRFFKSPPIRQEVYLSSLRIDKIDSVPRLNIKSIYTDRKYETQTIIKTERDVGQNIYHTESQRMIKTDRSHIKSILQKDQFLVPDFKWSLKQK